MQESSKSASAKAKESDSSPLEEIRVTDRRRISLDPQDAGAANVDSDGSAWAERSLKPTYVEELEERTQAAERKALDVNARFAELSARLQQEADETRQRLNRAADERARGDKANFISALLPVLDDLKRAVRAAEDGSSFASVMDGVRGTAANFENALAAAGVESVETVNAPFNPELHEAVDTIEVEPDKDGFVTEEYSRGYRMGERLLRPARVQVGRVAGQARRAPQ